MATLGLWTGGTTSVLPGTSWAAPSGLFPTQARNDAGAYSFASATSTLTLPSSDLADGYLVRATVEHNDTSNNRVNHQGRLILASGTGNVVAPPAGGYSRNNNNNNAFVSCWLFIDNPSAAATIQYQLKRDTDAPTGGTNFSSLEVIPLFYSNAGLYQDTTAALYGGTTPNVTALGTTVLQSDAAAIERSGNTVTVKGNNKRYLVISGQYREGGSGRTQRWFGHSYDGTLDDAAKSYAYFRNGNNDKSGNHVFDLIETSTADRTIELVQYRGIGVGTLQGGAVIDGSTGSNHSRALVVLELNDSAEVIRSTNTGASNQNLDAGSGTAVDLSVANTVDFNDAASFDGATASQVNVNFIGDAFIGANISGANRVNNGTRYTGRCRITLNGIEETHVFHGNYYRGDQGTQDTFGYSSNPVGFVAVTDTDQIGVGHEQYGDGGDVTLQAGWGGFFAINLDTLAGSPPAAFELDVDTGTFVSTGIDAELFYQQAATLAADTGAFLAGGSDAALLVSRNLDSDAGLFTSSGVAADVSADFQLQGEVGSFISSFQASQLAAERLIEVEVGQYIAQGVNALLGAGRAFQVDPGSFASAGIDAAFARSLQLPGSVGAFSLVGQPSDFLVNRQLPGGVGSFALGTAPADFTRSLRLAGDAGAYLVQGQNAILNYVQGNELSAIPGSFLAGPQDAGLLIDRVFQAEPGAFTSSGVDALLARGRLFQAGPGSFIAGTQGAELLRSLILGADPGAFSLTGIAADFPQSKSLSAEPGSYTVTTQEGGFTLELLLQTDPGAFLVTGVDAGFQSAGAFGLEAGPFSIGTADARFVRSLRLPLQEGAFTSAGTLAYLQANYRLLSDPAAFVSTFFDSDFPLVVGFFLEPGEFQSLGLDASLTVDRLLGADASSFLVQSAAADLLGGRQFQVDTGAFLSSSSPADFLAAYRLATGAGAYLVEPQDANLARSLLLELDAGAFTISTVDATLFRIVPGPRPFNAQVTTQVTTQSLDLGVDTQSPDLEVDTQSLDLGVDADPRECLDAELNIDSGDTLRVELPRRP